jgi:hypothetical protein
MIHLAPLPAEHVRHVRDAHLSGVEAEDGVPDASVGATTAVGFFWRLGEKFASMLG